MDILLLNCDHWAACTASTGLIGHHTYLVRSATNSPSNDLIYENLAIKLHSCLLVSPVLVFRHFKFILIVNWWGMHRIEISKLRSLAQVASQAHDITVSKRLVPSFLWLLKSTALIDACSIVGKTAQLGKLCKFVTWNPNFVPAFLDFNNINWHHIFFFTLCNNPLACCTTRNVKKGTQNSFWLWDRK